MSVKFIGVGGPGQIGNLQKTGKNQEAKKADGAGKDSVEFSSVLQDVNKAKAAQAGSPSERAEKVQALKAQISEGSYQPDLNKVASSLLQFLIEEK